MAATKRFVVFAVLLDDKVLFEPKALSACLPEQGSPPELHVLPWEDTPIMIDFGSRESLDRAAAELNDRVAAIEQEDPWVKRVIGVSGLGEGLVLYPAVVDGKPTMLGMEDLAVLMFKAKGEKHRTAGTKTAVLVDPAVVTSVQEFVALMVTDARLRQGLELACGGARDPKQTAAFISWISADVRKESVAEIEACGLTWPQAEKAVQTAARVWFLRKEGL